ncbi:transcriptional regulator [Pseudonocardia sulfidoxydans NBRC 16205]|uniref:Glycerol operon regulatory protein n=1 Tax=Pseudonocardia sulfidoxydans NBRC 16205 TaxID=1223511 RepID=A0A511D8W0_9PSEU|nr:helix-turn-helix domain-containing protein [Pseudonocardia sulfidoxydans]GEL21240.1 transcriptional regulator [Pseudonocardia sulfidoxydans NBRC 16205]
MAADDPDHRPGQIAQTLERGLKILETMQSAPDGMTISQIAGAQGLPRTVATRLVATLARNGFVIRATDGRYHLGYKLLTLARAVAQSSGLSTAPLLAEAARDLDATIVVMVANGDEAVVISSVEPPSGAFRVGMRPGSRLPIQQAAHGWAILAGRDAVPGELAEVTEARRRGYAVSVGEVLPHFAGICAPITVAGHTDGSVGFIIPRERSDEFEKLGAAVIDLAGHIALTSF